MKLLHYMLLLAVAGALACVSMADSKAGLGPSGHVPIEISIVQGPDENGAVTYRVRLAGVAAQTHKVAIFSSDVSAYDSLPTLMNVYQGTDIGDFQANISEDPPESWILNASCNGGTAQLVHYSTNRK